MINNVQKTIAYNEARESLKLQLAQYLAQQPESTHAVHSWMKRLEVASLGIIIAAFIFALYISFKWASVPVTAIPAAWFLFVASVLPTLMLFGVHVLLVKAFPTVVLPGRPNRFVVGSQAMKTGWFLILSSVVSAVIWGYLTFKIWTSDYATMGAILGIVIGVGIIVQLIYTLYGKISKSH
jgi:hypothetical protein